MALVFDAVASRVGGRDESAPTVKSLPGVLLPDRYDDSPSLRGDAKIVGGEAAARNAWPWQVALYRRAMKDGKPLGADFLFCGGSLISPRWGPPPPIASTPTATAISTPRRLRNWWSRAQRCWRLRARRWQQQWQKSCASRAFSCMSSGMRAEGERMAPPGAGCAGSFDAVALPSTGRATPQSKSTV